MAPIEIDFLALEQRLPDRQEFVGHYAARIVIEMQSLARQFPSDRRR